MNQCGRRSIKTLLVPALLLAAACSGDPASGQASDAGLRSDSALVWDDGAAVKGSDSGVGLQLGTPGKTLSTPAVQNSENYQIRSNTRLSSPSAADSTSESYTLRQGSTVSRSENYTLLQQGSE